MPRDKGAIKRSRVLLEVCSFRGVFMSGIPRRTDRADRFVNAVLSRDNAPSETLLRFRSRRTLHTFIGSRILRFTIYLFWPVLPDDGRVQFLSP